MSIFGWHSVQDICKIASTWDIIEIELTDSLINHFVLYVGNGACVHVVPSISDKKLNLTTGIMSSVIPSVLSGGGGIKERVLLEEYNGCMCRVNNLEHEAKERGLVPRSASEIEREAKKGIEEGRCYVPYSVTSSNCEHYCVVWKYKTDNGFSPQAKSALTGAAKGAIAGAIIGGPFAGVTAIGGAAVGAVCGLMTKKALPF